jgi:hypothetical protein
MEEFHLTRVGPAMLADAFPLAEAEANVLANMHGLWVLAKVHGLLLRA